MNAVTRVDSRILIPSAGVVACSMRELLVDHVRMRLPDPWGLHLVRLGLAERRGAEEYAPTRKCRCQDRRADRRAYALRLLQHWRQRDFVVLLDGTMEWHRATAFHAFDAWLHNQPVAAGPSGATFKE